MFENIYVFFISFFRYNNITHNNIIVGELYREPNLLYLQIKTILRYHFTITIEKIFSTPTNYKYLILSIYYELSKLRHLYRLYVKCDIQIRYAYINLPKQ